MKAQLVVVQGKPEGKVIPLVGSSFKVGRGESCHLRPNSERVSREHAEFILKPESLSVRDMGSRNGTLVNGKALTATEVYVLKNRDLVQVGPLTFAVAILDTPAAVATPKSASPAMAKASPDDVSHDEIDSWIVGAGTGSTADLPTTVQGGETLTNLEVTSKPKSGVVPVPAATRPASSPVLPVTTEEEQEPEDLDSVEEEAEEAVEEVTSEIYDHFDSEEEAEEDDSDEDSGPKLDEFVDESNPFHAAKKALATPAKVTASQDTSDVAHDILRRLMQQKKAAKSS